MNDDRFRKGLEAFNSRDYFEAHEVWEDLWHEYRETDRTFLQALIQIAAGLYHLDCGNAVGARSQLSKGLAKLEHYPPVHHGVDIPALTSAINNCLAQVPDSEIRTPFDIMLFPQIHLR